MLPSLLSRHVNRFAPLLLAGSVALMGCAGRSSSQSDSDGGTGNTTAATGGTSSGSGGTGAVGAKGGNTASGGASGSTGGTGVGGTTDPGKGGTGAAPSCTGVTCPSIPNTCKKILQPEDECCPTCLDSGCPTDCVLVDCNDGEHAETLPGDCCPTCVADPPDACETGQETYQNLKDALLDKYGSSGCKNSAECAIVYENNACVSTCGVALPSSTLDNYLDNLNNYAEGCATCDPPRAIPCPAFVAACVNGMCVATGP